MERITDIGTLLSRFQEEEEETMVTRFHGIDRHKKYSTISVFDRDGRETIRTLRRLFASYTLLNRQIRMLKNTIQAMLAEAGVVLC
jgi:hypothetical protein